MAYIISWESGTVNTYARNTGDKKKKKTINNFLITSFL